MQFAAGSIYGDYKIGKCYEKLRRQARSGPYRQGVPPGRSAAFVGHNGCGKSTLLRIIAGLTVPSDGRAVQAPGLLFHYIPEKFPPIPVTARQYLQNMGILDGMRRDEAGRRIESLGEDFFLSELLDVPMKSLSKGTLQKIGVIQALVTRPDVLLLDEPVSGQDKEPQKVLIEKTNELRGRGCDDTAVVPRRAYSECHCTRRIYHTGGKAGGL